MPSYLPFGYGAQRLVDAQQRFIRSGLPVYLRLREFTVVGNEEALQLGFRTQVPGSGGISDVLIAPPPSTSAVSVHNIGQSNGKLRFGARIFGISATFTEKQVTARSLANQELVWRAKDVVGLVTEGLLFSIEDIKHRDVAGRIVMWFLTCNANELK